MLPMMKIIVQPRNITNRDNNLITKLPAIKRKTKNLIILRVVFNVCNKKRMHITHSHIIGEKSFLFV